MARWANYDLTGKFLDDLPLADYRDYVINRCEGLVAGGEPLLMHHNRVLDGKLRQYEALWLPLSENGVEVSMLLCALIYDLDRISRPGTTVKRWSFPGKGSCAFLIAATSGSFGGNRVAQQRGDRSTVLGKGSGCTTAIMRRQSVIPTLP